MNKAFVKEGVEDETLIPVPTMPVGVKNYITPAGFEQMQQELQRLSTARDSGLGESIDARERDQRIHYLQARLETAEIVDPSVHEDGGPIRFGATVTYEHQDGAQHAITIVGLDEIDPADGRISWLSPIAQALLNAEPGDSVVLESPSGEEELVVIEVRYPKAAEP